MIAHVMFNFNGKSEDSERCLYRGPNETKCAVGMFIPDELYHTSMDRGGSAATDLIRSWTRLGGLMPLNSDDMQKFQYVHDMSCPENTLDDLVNWIEANVK